jgi:transcriptional regulator GlxA family with amidase domain
MVHRIAVLAVENVVVLDLGMPTQAFGTSLDEAGMPRYRVEVCSVDGRPVMTSAGFSAAVEHDISLLEQADTVIVPGGTWISSWGFRDERIGVALRAAKARGARIMSICTGAFVLAAAGILDGHRATTHWRYADTFRELFPAVELDRDVLFVDDGVLTSAGVAAGLDLCIYVLRKDFGAAAANTAARRMVMAPERQGGQAQFIERTLPGDDGDELSAVLTWASGNLAAELSVDELARRASMSVRSFTRHFRARTGSSPAAWVASERLGYAKELLEKTELYVDEVARHTGIGTAAHLRSQFHRRFGQSPTAYRRVYRGPSA